MYYLGSKRKLAPELTAVMLPSGSGFSGKVYEPFVGGANMLLYGWSGVPYERRVGSDINKYLIALLRWVGSGQIEYPGFITKEQYVEGLAEIRSGQLKRELWWYGWLGFGCSTMRIWGAGYGDRGGEAEELQLASWNRLVSDYYNGLGRVVLMEEDCGYLAREGDIVYCDPPYVGAAGYGTGWNRASLERLINLLRRYAGTCYLSEQVDLSDDSRVELVWEKEVVDNITRGKEAVERLYLINK